MPTIEDFLDGSPHPFLPPPPTAPPTVNIQNTLFGPTAPVFLPTSNSNLDINAQPIRTAPPNISTREIGNDLFGSQAATTFRENKTKTETQQEVDDFLFEMPEKKIPDLELGDGLINFLGTEAESIFDKGAPPSKKEEEDEILKDFMKEYNIEDMKETMDKSTQISESFFFLWWTE